MICVADVRVFESKPPCRSLRLRGRHLALLHPLLEHLVELAANPLGTNALPQHLLRFDVIESLLHDVCGIEAQQEGRGGNSLKVSTNWKTWSIIP